MMIQLFTFFIGPGTFFKKQKKEELKVLKLEREKANRETFFDFLNSHRPSFLILNGHGDEKTIYGYNDEKIVEEGDEEALKEKIVYTIACDAAKSLGKSIVEKGGKCFIGYNRKFVFCMDETRMTRPLEDEKAASFFNATNKISISIIKGNSSLESVEKAKEGFRKEIVKWRLSKDLEAPFILRALIWDLHSLVHLGENSFFE